MGGPGPCVQRRGSSPERKARRTKCGSLDGEGWVSGLHLYRVHPRTRILEHFLPPQLTLGLWEWGAQT